MPELNWEYGYYGSIGIIVLSMVAMLLFLRIKKWF
jgi:Mg2+ and Co2+ transporter CorA